MRISAFVFRLFLMSHSTSGAEMLVQVFKFECVLVRARVCVYLHEKNRETHSNCRTESWKLFAHIVKREIIYPHRAMAVRLIRKIVRILFDKPVRSIFPFLFWLVIREHIPSFSILFRIFASQTELGFRFFPLSRFLVFGKKIRIRSHITAPHIVCFDIGCANDRDGRLSIHECVSRMKGYIAPYSLRSFYTTPADWIGRDINWCWTLLCGILRYVIIISMISKKSKNMRF